MKMGDNVFMDFIETYWEDIAAFLNALGEWVRAIIDKMGTADAE